MIDAAMTVRELRDILERLGWTQGYLAEMAGRDNSHTRKMCRGKEPIDAELAQWLRKMDARARSFDEVANVPPPKPRRVTA
jgi:transcriptional regulator with XRE-family HTH domain